MVRAPGDTAEPVLGALLELAPEGLEQLDGPDWVEFALYASAGAALPLSPGRARLGGVAVDVRCEAAPGDWEERWKRFHRAELVGGRLYVRPPWEAPAVRPGVAEVVIDPGQAFGTGTHPTTRMCLELILALPARGSFVDLGCGSGVLSIAAAKLGFRPVVAIDADRGAVAETLRNARVNRVELDRVDRFDLRRSPAPAADVVAANLMRPLLLRVAQLIQTRPQFLIVAGLLDHEADEVAAAFAPLRERRRLSDRGWTALLLERGG